MINNSFIRQFLNVKESDFEFFRISGCFFVIGIILFYKRHILLHISRGVEFFFNYDLFVMIINHAELNGHIRSLCDIEEAGSPMFRTASRSFRSHCKIDIIRITEFFHNIISEMAATFPFNHRNATQ